MHNISILQYEIRIRGEANMDNARVYPKLYSETFSFVQKRLQILCLMNYPSGQDMDKSR
jgi:hypothetical protein